MQPPITIIAEMRDGTCIVEDVASFEDFTAIALPLWHDSECIKLTWQEAPPPETVVGALCLHDWRMVRLADLMGDDPRWLAGHVTTPALMRTFGVTQLQASLIRCSWYEGDTDLPRIAARHELDAGALAAAIAEGRR